MISRVFFYIEFKKPSVKLGLNFLRRGKLGSPFRHSPDGKCSRARTRGFCLSLRSNKNIAPSFSSPTQAKQFACSCIKKPSVKLGLNFLRRGGLEPPSQRHAPLKRTRIPIPPPARLYKLYHILLLPAENTSQKIIPRRNN